MASTWVDSSGDVRTIDIKTDSDIQIYASVCDSKAREGKCDLLKSLGEMRVSNPSPLCSEEVLISTDEAGPNAHLHPVGQELFTRRLGGDEIKAFAGIWVLGSLFPSVSL